MARTKPWEVSDEFWEKVEPLIPPAPSHAKGGRTRMDDRDAFAAIIYVLRTGMQWNALPREMGASSTVHDRYQEWERLGFFEHLWRVGLLEYEEVEGIEWEWQALDGAMSKKAPLGRGASGEATGKNPTDRAKMGTKRSMLTDGAGIPLAVALDGANRHDSKLLVATLEGLVVARPSCEEEEGTVPRPEQHLCLGMRPTTPMRCEKSWRPGATKLTSLPPTRRSGPSAKRPASTPVGERGVGWWSAHILG